MPSVTVTRHGREAIATTALELSPSDFGLVENLPSGAYRLAYPHGWRVRQTAPLRWRVEPLDVDFDAPQTFRLRGLADQGIDATVDVQVNLDLRSALDLAAVVLPKRNRASELGEVDPERPVFDATFKLMPEPLRRLLFAGIYSDIVFLHGQGRKGGLCSGMARWTIARARGDEPAPASEAEAVERIRLYHGRQMKDRALLSALPWFLRGSPKAAFRAVRSDLLEHGVTDRALDLAIPKLWRRDLAKALVQEGHSLVPYRLRQEGHCARLYRGVRPESPERGTGCRARTAHHTVRSRARPLRLRFAGGSHADERRHDCRAPERLRRPRHRRVGDHRIAAVRAGAGLVSLARTDRRIANCPDHAARAVRALSMSWAVAYDRWGSTFSRMRGFG